MTADSGAKASSEPKTARSELILSAVTVLYTFLALAFQFPKLQNSLSPVYTAWKFLGLQQKWNLFAPTIPATTAHLIGIVTLADGTKVLFAPPHPANHPWYERMAYNRYLKWEADYAPFSPYGPYLAQLGKHILKEFSFRGSKPGSCTLFMEFSPISKPEAKLSPRDLAPQHWFQVPIYRTENREEGTDAGSSQ